MSLFSRLAGLAVLVLSLAPLAGCDGVDATAGTTGPTVQFGASAASILEGSVRADSVALTTVGTRVSIPVRLTGSNGTPVSVEVLYASNGSVSTARPGARNSDGTFPTGVDFVDFGSVSEGFQKATVQFSGQADETQTVTFTVVRDGVAEVSEAAVFALQRPVGATIGSVREFTANIGVPTIAAVRQGALLSTVTVEGIVTRAKGRNVWIQDATGGIILFGPAGSALTVAIGLGTERGGIAVGDLVQATGRLVEFQPTAGTTGTGLLEVDFVAVPASPGTLYISRGNPLPAAQTATLAQITAGDPDNDTYESEIVRVEGLTIDPIGDIVFAAAKSYTVSQTVDGTTTTAILRIGSAGDTDLIGTTIPTGTFAFQGPVGQFRGGNQLAPILISDLIATP